MSGEKITGDLLFPISDNAVNALWETALKASGQFSQDTDTGRNTLRVHSFRKFFISQISMAGSEKLAQILSGHAGYLSGSYDRVSVEQLAKEYLKIEHAITIGIPEGMREASGEIVNKMKLQEDSIEGLRQISCPPD